MLSILEEDHNNNNDSKPEVNIPMSNKNPSVISSIERRNSEDTDIDEDDREFGVKITQELFRRLLNRVFFTLMCIIGFLLISFWIGDAKDYNIFPFTVNKANTWWYQVAQCIFLLSYWTKKILLLRIFTILGYSFFIGWAIDAGGNPSMDFYLFTCIYVLINIEKIAELLYEKRRIEFDEYRQKIYDDIFHGIMSANDFQELSKTALIRELRKGQLYCKIKDKCHNLSILVVGRIRIYKTNENVKNTFINEGEFIDSAEWLLKQSNKEKGRRFNYYMKAEEKCTYLTWPREILYETLKENTNLQEKLNGALGIDVSNKLFNNSSLY